MRTKLVQKVGTRRSVESERAEPDLISNPDRMQIQFVDGGSDGARTRDLRRDRPAVYLGKSKTAPTFRCPKASRNPFIVGTQAESSRRPIPVVSRQLGGGAEKSEINPMDRRPLLQVSQMYQVSQCGAKTRAGSPCRRPPVQGRKRCRLHGGLSPGAPRGTRNGNYANGEWTADAIEERRWLRSLVLNFAKAETGR